MIPRGFHVIGSLIIKNSDDVKRNASEAIDAARELRRQLSGEAEADNCVTVAAVADSASADINFFVSRYENSASIEPIDSVLYDDNSEKYVWERGCLIRCELPLKLPFYYPVKNPAGEFCHF